MQQNDLTCAVDRYNRFLDVGDNDPVIQVDICSCRADRNASGCMAVDIPAFPFDNHVVGKSSRRNGGCVERMTSGSHGARDEGTTADSGLSNIRHVPFPLT